MLARVPHVGVAVGLCHGSHLMKTLQDGQSIKQSRDTDVWAGVGQKKKKKKVRACKVELLRHGIS